MRGDFCSKCGEGIVESKTGKICPSCLQTIYHLNQRKVTINLCIRITEKQREKFREDLR